MEEFRFESKLEPFCVACMMKMRKSKRRTIKEHEGEILNKREKDSNKNRITESKRNVFSAKVLRSNSICCVVTVQWKEWKEKLMKLRF